ncbi:hypothetical protein AAU57_10940 [Nonlabens sp. YIK11]|uniref:DUF6503 family protein n=1 Tax=Nonlabens sp. YIK11 TaxID=1453349 RepID=UPI000707D7E0|nr:DUF6503 family protein [Nonlabens sp. YIK11]KQC34612.1 hypothetical protein AAU57_10940 [Nonlabens sp. YIK11]
MKHSYLIMVCFAFAKANSQQTPPQLTGPQLLEKAIAYHDPKGNWSRFADSLEILTTSPDMEDRTSNIKINLPAKSFELVSKRGDIVNEYTVLKDSIVTAAKMDLSQMDTTFVMGKEDFKRAVFMRDYYTYLYGLPMKLKDKGTVISYEVERKMLKEKEYLVLRADYDPSVGSDIWFFYFDPETYRMEAYQFYKQKEPRVKDPKSGEFILLSEEYKTNGIKMPKVRKWYYNKNDKYLATDTIVD